MTYQRETIDTVAILLATTLLIATLAIVSGLFALSQDNRDAVESILTAVVAVISTYVGARLGGKRHD